MFKDALLVLINFLRFLIGTPIAQSNSNITVCHDDFKLHTIDNNNSIFSQVHIYARTIFSCINRESMFSDDRNIKKTKSRRLFRRALKCTR